MAFPDPSPPKTIAPQITPSMKNAFTDIGLDRLDVIHAGKETYPLASCKSERSAV